MKWYPLSPIHWVLLLILVAVTDVFTMVQKYFVPEIARPFAYIILVIVVLLAFFFIVRPEEPMVLAQTLCIILSTITLVLVLVQDVILTFSLSWKTFIVVLGPVLGPVIAAYIYLTVYAPENA
jgi:hypothetical protein